VHMLGRVAWLWFGGRARGDHRRTRDVR
jgi:hypothetical protein